MPISPDQHSPSWDGGSARGDFEQGGGTLGRALGEGFRGIVSGITDALNGVFSTGSIFAGIGKYAKQVRDGQEDLNSRTDLLGVLMDYGSAYSSTSFTGTGLVPFESQIGPMRNVSLVSGGGLRFGDKGLWDIRVHLTMSWVAVLSNKVQVSVVVYNPQGAEFSRQTSQDANSGNHTHTIVMSVVVPEEGYFVRVHVENNASTREVPRGPRWSRIVAQHISREVEGRWNRGSESSDSNDFN